MEYNCKECKSYWDGLPYEDRDDLKDALYYVPIELREYIKLYCPKCKRTKREW